MVVNMFKVGDKVKLNKKAENELRGLDVVAVLFNKKCIITKQLRKAANEKNIFEISDGMHCWTFNEIFLETARARKSNLPDWW